MITILTETPDEVAESLKSYFLITDHYAIIIEPEEIDELLNVWCEEFDGSTSADSDKIEFKLPFLLITSNRNLINVIVSNFETALFNEIIDINEASKTFISKGFLPLNHDLIRSIAEPGANTTDTILSIFQQLGYVKPVSYLPTDRLLNALSDDEEYSKYAQLLTLYMSNFNENTDTERYKQIICEILKLVDINVHLALTAEPNE